MIVALRLCRKKKITNTTRTTASSSSISTSWTEARIPLVRSDSTVTFSDGGRAAVRSGSCFLMASTVAMTLAPGWRWTLTMIAGVLPDQAPRREFSAPWITLATSARRTEPPFRVAMIRFL